MTLIEAKNQVAKSHGYESWESATAWFQQVEQFTDEAAELYARSKWEEACDRQILLCAGTMISRNSIARIIDSPKPEFKP